jgi:hypothetical protein
MICRGCTVIQFTVTRSRGMYSVVFQLLILWHIVERNYKKVVLREERKFVCSE